MQIIFLSCALQNILYSFIYWSKFLIYCYAGTSVLDMESRLHARLPSSDACATVSSCSSSNMSLVSSILNEQQSRPSATERLKFPTPPLIEPCFEALSRYATSLLLA